MIASSAVTTSLVPAWSVASLPAFRPLPVCVFTRGPSVALGDTNEPPDTLKTPDWVKPATPASLITCAAAASSPFSRASAIARLTSAGTRGANRSSHVYVPSTARFAPRSFNENDGDWPPVNSRVKYAPEGAITTRVTPSKSGAACHVTAAPLTLGAIFGAANARAGTSRITRTPKRVLLKRDMSTLPFPEVNENASARRHRACLLMQPWLTGRNGI